MSTVADLETELAAALASFASATWKALPFDPAIGYLDRGERGFSFAIGAIDFFTEAPDSNVRSQGAEIQIRLEYRLALGETDRTQRATKLAPGIAVLMGRAWWEALTHVQAVQLPEELTYGSDGRIIFTEGTWGAFLAP